MRLVCRANGTEAAPHCWAVGCLARVAKALLVCPGYLIKMVYLLSSKHKQQLHHVTGAESLLNISEG